MKKRTGAAFSIIYAALLCCAGAVWGQEAAAQPTGEERHTIHIRGDFTRGTIIVQRDMAGKVTVTTPRFNADAEYELTPALCPLIPEWVDCVRAYEDRETIIEGNTLTETHSNGWWRKMVMDGATITTTTSDGEWEKKVVDGNTTTYTMSNGYWEKTVVDGNATTRTDSEGRWAKTVVDGDTTTFTSSSGWRWKTVVDGNTTTTTYPNGDWDKTVVDGTTATTTTSHGGEKVVEKRGHDIFIRME